jgi:CDP-6-deoxy-D-xylo-4-hexulose-3-dehydrase
MGKTADELKNDILDKVRQYYEVQFGSKKSFSPGDRINYGGRVFDENELVHLVDSALEFWLTTGRYAEQFEKDFADFLGVKYCSLTNSGSSANLLAFSALTDPQLGQRAIKKGDEVITVACSFPTTVAPILQYGAVPVFLDITIPEYNIDVSQLKAAITEKTKAVMVAHTLGNPFNLRAVKKLCDKYGLWLIEDNCDALGSRYEMEDGWYYTGTVGDIGTSSFYPPHHMTMGEGGAVYTNSMQLKRIVESFRDWGRDCWCPSGKDNTCRHRYDGQYGELPAGYDHKYVYSRFGYNLKVTDMQAAIGCAQLKKLPSFIKARQTNFQFLRSALEKYSDKLILPEATECSDPSWFGLLITVRDGAGVTRDALVNHLEAHNIQTRMLFASNLLRHPCFNELRGTEAYRVPFELRNTDIVLNNTFWIGVYPGMTDDMLETMANCIGDFLEKVK